MKRLLVLVLFLMFAFSLSVSARCGDGFCDPNELCTTCGEDCFCQDIKCCTSGDDCVKECDSGTCENFCGPRKMVLVMRDIECDYNGMISFTADSHYFKLYLRDTYVYYKVDDITTTYETLGGDWWLGRDKKILNNLSAYPEINFNSTKGVAVNKTTYSVRIKEYISTAKAYFTDITVECPGIREEIIEINETNVSRANVTEFNITDYLENKSDSKEEIVGVSPDGIITHQAPPREIGFWEKFWEFWANLFS